MSPDIPRRATWPEAVVNDKTLVVFFMFRLDPYKLEYETDLIEEFCRENVAMKTLAVAPSLPKQVSDMVDYSVSYGEAMQGEIDDDLRPPIDVIAGQLLGVYKALDLGFKPDAPSTRGVISRVVKAKFIPLKDRCSAFRERRRLDRIRKRHLFCVRSRVSQ